MVNAKAMAVFAFALRVCVCVCICIYVVKGLTKKTAQGYANGEVDDRTALYRC